MGSLPNEIKIHGEITNAIMDFIISDIRNTKVLTVDEMRQLKFNPILQFIDSHTARK